MAAFIISFTYEAEEELLSAYFWYENKRKCLGEDFKKNLDLKIKSLKQNPKTSTIIYKDIRSARIKTYPYNLLYRIINSHIQIIAIFHHSRNPKEWRKRI